MKIKSPVQIAFCAACIELYSENTRTLGRHIDKPVRMISVCGQTTIINENIFLSVRRKIFYCIEQDRRHIHITVFVKSIIAERIENRKLRGKLFYKRIALCISCQISFTRLVR